MCSYSETSNGLDESPIRHSTFLKRSADLARATVDGFVADMTTLSVYEDLDVFDTEPSGRREDKEDSLERSLDDARTAG